MQIEVNAGYGLIFGFGLYLLDVPDATLWGVVAGTLARTQGYQPQQRNACLNDALIFLTAAKAGLAVLTSNRDEFDLIQQLTPEGRFIGY